MKMKINQMYTKENIFHKVEHLDIQSKHNNVFQYSCEHYKYMTVARKRIIFLRITDFSHCAIILHITEDLHKSY